MFRCYTAVVVMALLIVKLLLTVTRGTPSSSPKGEGREDAVESRLDTLTIYISVPKLK